MLPDLNQLLNPLLAIVAQASCAIIDIYNDYQTIDVMTKPDQTPVTEADYLAHQIIFSQLQQLTPNIPVLSEEGIHIPFHERKQWACYWLVDPLDGTRDFINRTGEFSINVALVHQHRAIFGIVYQPLIQLGYYAIQGQGAYKVTPLEHVKQIHVRIKPVMPTIVISARHNPKKLQHILINSAGYEIMSLGSALKICRVAEGLADIYPRLGPTSEWDTAAGQCILEEAGGRLINLQGEPLMYNTKDSLLNPGFIGIGDSQFDWLKYLNTNHRSYT